MFQLVGYERDWRTSKALTERLRQARGQGRFNRNDLINAAMEGDAERVEELIEILPEPNVSGQLRHPVQVATWAGDYRLGDRLARLQTRPENTPLQRLEGHVNLADLLVAHGRWAEASAELDRAAELDPARIRLQRAILATLPFLPVPEGDLLDALVGLERWEPAAPEPGATPATAYDRHVRLYLLGLLSSKLGRFDEALAQADAVEALPDQAGTAVPGELATSIRADVAWRRGDSPEAVLQALGPLRGHLPAVLFSRPEFTQEHARYVRAAALIATGEHDEAIRWLDDTLVITPGWVYYPAPAAFLKAEALDALGRSTEAEEARRTYRTFWSEPDAEVALPGRRAMSAPEAGRFQEPAAA